MQQVFVLNIGRLPSKRWHPIKRRICEKALLETPGMIDFCDMSSGHGTLLFFGTRTHAEKALAAMIKSGNPVEEQILVADADYNTHQFTIRGPLED